MASRCLCVSVNTRAPRRGRDYIVNKIVCCGRSCFVVITKKGFVKVSLLFISINLYLFNFKVDR